MDTLQELIRRTVEGIRARDPRLAEELAGFRARGPLTARSEQLAARLAQVTDDVAGLLPAARDLGELRPVLPPVFAVVNGGPALKFPDAENAVWRERLENAGQPLRTAIGAVGRLEVKGLPGYEWVGTGVMVADGVVATCQHVAARFARQRNGRFRVRSNVGGVKMEPSIDFLEEADRAESLVFRIADELVHQEVDEEPDVALLRVVPDGDHPLPEPVRLSTGEVKPDDFVAVIGYPARDSRARFKALVEALFHDVFDKKRVAPGQVKRTAEGLLVHDCSVLRGNSGSPVVSLATGELLGLQFEGEFMSDNFAVSAAALAQVLKNAGVGGGADEPRTRVLAGRAGDGGAAGTPHGPTTVTVPIHVTITIDAPLVVGNGAPAPP